MAASRGLRSVGVWYILVQWIGETTFEEVRRQ